MSQTPASTLLPPLPCGDRLPAIPVAPAAAPGSPPAAGQPSPQTAIGNVPGGPLSLPGATPVGAAAPASAGSFLTHPWVPSSWAAAYQSALDNSLPQAAAALDAAAEAVADWGDTVLGHLSGPLQSLSELQGIIQGHALTNLASQSDIADKLHGVAVNNAFSQLAQLGQLVNTLEYDLAQSNPQSIGGQAGPILPGTGASPQSPGVYGGVYPAVAGNAQMGTAQIPFGPVGTVGPSGNPVGGYSAGGGTQGIVHQGMQTGGINGVSGLGGATASQGATPTVGGGTTYNIGGGGYVTVQPSSYPTVLNICCLKREDILDAVAELLTGLAILLGKAKAPPVSGASQPLKANTPSGSPQTVSWKMPAFDSPAGSYEIELPEDTF